MACAAMQVLTALQRLVNVLGPDSAVCHPLLLPLLRYCTDITQARRAKDMRIPLKTLSTKSLKYMGSHIQCIMSTSVPCQSMTLWGSAQPEELNLLEDGLQLWLVALRNAPGPRPALLEPLPHLVAIMDRSTGCSCPDSEHECKCQHWHMPT